MTPYAGHTYGAEHARARGVEDDLGVHIGLDGGGDVSDVMREEAGIWGDDLNTCMEYRIRRDDWNMGTPAALAVPRVVRWRRGGATARDARGGDGWS